MDYQLDKWKRQDWHKGTRHYCCEVKQDLTVDIGALMGPSDCAPRSEY